MPKEPLKEIAEKLIAFGKENNESEGLDTLYAPDAVSVEAMPMPGTDSCETKGVDGIRAKHDWWNTMMEVHSTSTEGPFYHGDTRFGLIYDLDATNKETNEHMAGKEIAIYTVNNGKIVREEFFYDM